MCAVLRNEPAPARPVPPRPPGGGRLWELDVLRTVAIGLMVVFHAGYDVDFLAPQVGLEPFEGWWQALQVTCASTFLGLVGVSFWITHQRGLARGLAGGTLYRHHARRGLQVAGAALLVSLATWAALGSHDAVRFGILHLIATAMLVVLPLTVRLGAFNLLLGVAAVATGVTLTELDVQTDVTPLLALGLDPGYAGVDWYPLLPWVGATLVGLALGALLYPGGERSRLLRRLEREPRGAHRAGAPGRHSLPVYLVHQPVLIALTGVALDATGTDVDWS
jgi:uncharacterized membrane protein